MIIDNSKVIDQTKAIERVPKKPGLIGSLGLFRGESVATDAVTFDVRENSLHILDDKLRNVDNKNAMNPEQYDIHTLAIPHYPVSNVIGREKLAGVRGFGKEGEVMIATAVANELERQSERHDVHEEYLKAQMAINGKVVTNHYGTIDMATEFGVVRPTQNLSLSDGKLLESIRAATTKSRNGLQTGGRANGYIALMGNTMFEALLSSADIKTAYQFSNATGNPLRNELGTVANGYTMFRLGNVDFILYDDSFSDKTGKQVNILAPNAGVLLPRAELGRVFYGPASTLSGLGSFGSKRFATSYRDPKDRYIEVESEQSTLAINEQFGATVALTFSF